MLKLTYSYFGPDTELQRIKLGKVSNRDLQIKDLQEEL